MSYDAQHNPEISGELQRPMMKKLLSCIRDCGVTFSVYLEDDGGFTFTSLVDGDKKEVVYYICASMLFVCVCVCVCVRARNHAPFDFAATSSFRRQCKSVPIKI